MILKRFFSPKALDTVGRVLFRNAPITQTVRYLFLGIMYYYAFQIFRESVVNYLLKSQS